LLLSGPKGVERWNCHCREAYRFHVALARQAQSVQTAFLRSADFSNADLTNANLAELTAECNFAGANLQRCYLNLANCQLSGANVDGVTLLRLRGCTAENVDFSRVAAPLIRIEASNLNGSRFSGSTERRSFRLLDCSLVNAHFGGANLEDADFSRSDLSSADFRNANLKLVKFTGAKVDGADFTGAMMIGADVTGVDFSKAKGFDPSQLQGAGGPGPAVQEFLKIASQAQRVSTSLAVAQGSREIVLTLDVFSPWVHGRDTAGNFYHATRQQTPAAAADLWGKMATKWHGASPEWTSIKVSATKAPKPNKDLKALAVRAWCELFGVELPSDEELKSALASAKARRKEKSEEALQILKAGKKKASTSGTTIMRSCRRCLEALPVLNLPTPSSPALSWNGSIGRTRI